MINRIKFFNQMKYYISNTSIIMNLIYIFEKQNLEFFNPLKESHFFCFL